MEPPWDSVPLVSLAVSAAAMYARAISSLVSPGPWRLATLLPVVVVFVAAPLGFSSALFLAWLGTFKVVLLAFGSGPLDSGLPVIHFLLAATLPIELVVHPDTAAGVEARTPSKSKAGSASLATCSFKLAVIAAIVHIYHYSNSLHPYMRLFLSWLHICCSLDLVYTIAAAACRTLCAAEVKPQFNQLHLASSLRDFWGRRWNLPVSAVLRASVYDPVRARVGKETGILATFLVSGLMHEVLVCYLTLRPRPTGEMAAFFLLQGVCRVAEGRWTTRGWPPPPRPVARLLLLVFMLATAVSLIFPPVCRDGREEMLLKESEAAVAAFFARAGG